MRHGQIGNNGKHFPRRPNRRILKRANLLLLLPDGIKFGLTSG